MKTEIVQATPEHAAIIAANVRPEDRDELWATSYSTPEQAMVKGIEYSDASYTGMIDGEPVCMWGVVPDGLIFNSGVPWMVGSTALDKHSIRFLRQCRKPLMEILDRYDRLENHVDARNVRSVQWLKFMGFKIEEPENYGVLKLPFHRFWKESVRCAM